MDRGVDERRRRFDCRSRTNCGSWSWFAGLAFSGRDGKEAEPDEDEGGQDEQDDVESGEGQGSLVCA
jgi:hypothetical protein